MKTKTQNRMLMATSTLALTAALAGVVALPSRSSALPSDTTDPKYINSVLVPRDDTNGFRTLDVAGGMYIIGDSLSTFPGDLKVSADTVWSFNVNYAAAAAQTLQHKKVAVHAHSGFTAGDHLRRVNWPGNPTVPTVFDAAASNAQTVFIELGTNDVSCMHRSQYMPKMPGTTKTDAASLICDDNPKVLPDLPATAYSNWRTQQRTTIQNEVFALLDALTQTKCVIVAGPREVDLYGAKVEDNRWFNDMLKAYGALHPNARFHYANLDAYAKSNQAMKDDWGVKWSPYWETVGGQLRYLYRKDPAGSFEVHQHTLEASNALADFAVQAAKTRPGVSSAFFPTGGCGIDG